MSGKGCGVGMDNEIIVVEVSNESSSGYADRFDIKKMYISKGEKCLELTGEEARKLYEILKPPMA